MKPTRVAVFLLTLFNVAFVFSQDMKATTGDGQYVILRKSGGWFFFKPNTASPSQDITARLANGQIVILKKDGTWMITDRYDQSAIRKPSDAGSSQAQNPKVASLAERGHWEEKDWEVHRAMLNQPAPALELSGWMNAAVSRDDWAGKIVVVDFWATWCGPCRRAIPHNNEMFERYKDRGVLIIGACGSDGQDRMAEIVQQLGVQYPAGKVADSFVQAWNVMYWPTYAIVDRNGILRAIGVKPNYVEPIIQALLEEP
jgi:thiol-disulfide isomerase/thioredoxin